LHSAPQQPAVRVGLAAIRPRYLPPVDNPAVALAVAHAHANRVARLPRKVCRSAFCRETRGRHARRHQHHAAGIRRGRPRRSRHRDRRIQPPFR